MRILGIITLAFGLMFSLTSASLAHDNSKIMIEESWARASIGQKASGAAYLTIKNMGDTPHRLISATSDRAPTVMIHNTTRDQNGVMKMHHVMSIDIPAGGSVELSPGGLHIMLMGLIEPLVEGEKFDIDLTFEGDIKKTIHIPVLSATAQGHGGHEHEHEHDEHEPDAHKKDHDTKNHNH